MTDALLWFETVGREWMSWLLWMNVCTAALLVAAILVDRLLARRVSAHWRILLFIAVAARLALPVSWESPLGWRVAADSTIFAARAPSPLAGVIDPAWLSLVPAVHLAVALALAVGWCRVRWRVKRAVDDATPAPPEIVDEACGLAVAVSTAATARAVGPAVVGLRRPTLLLPSSLLHEDQAPARRLIVAHELAHVRRGDHWLVPALQWLQILFWPIAPLWIAVRRIRGLIEIACDGAALGTADLRARQLYAKQLLEHAGARHSFAAIALLGSSSVLGARLRAIAAPPRCWSAAAQVAIVILFGSVFIALSTASKVGALRPVAMGSVEARLSGLDRSGLVRDAADVPSPSNGAQVESARSSDFATTQPRARERSDQ